MFKHAYVLMLADGDGGLLPFGLVMDVPYRFAGARRTVCHFTTHPPKFFSHLSPDTRFGVRYGRRNKLPWQSRATVTWPYSTDRGVVTVAQKVQVILTDDIDGGEAEETVQFAIDGVSYEIDLSGANAEALREALAAYVDAGRRVGGRSTRRQPAAKASRPAAERADLGDVRSWARENGYQVSDRGRVSGEVRAAYEAAR